MIMSRNGDKWEFDGVPSERRESIVVSHNGKAPVPHALGSVTLCFRQRADLEGLQRLIDAECATFEQVGLPCPPLLRDLYKALEMELDGIIAREREEGTDGTA